MKKVIILNIVILFIFLISSFNICYSFDIPQIQLPPYSDAETKKRSLSTDEVMTSRSGTSYYRGMECSDDCSGHIAGYEWALDNNIREEVFCEKDNFSKSFAEGCLEGVYTNREPLDPPVYE